MVRKKFPSPVIFIPHRYEQILEENREREEKMEQERSEWPPV